MIKITKNKTMQFIAVIVTAFLFVGCGEGNFDENPVKNELVVGKATQVFPGDQLMPDEDTEINVVHRLSDDTKWVTLISGNASLLRGNFNLNN